MASDVTAENRTAKADQRELTATSPGFPWSSGSFWAWTRLVFCRPAGASPGTFFPVAGSGLGARVVHVTHTGRGGRCGLTMPTPFSPNDSNRSGPTPDAAKSGVQLSALPRLGSAPSSSSNRISGTSHVRAARTNGVDPVVVNLPRPDSRGREWSPPLRPGF